MGTLQGPLPLGILLFILAYTSASPVCNLGCNGSPGNLFNYEAGTNYKYKLEGTSETKLADSKGHVAKLGLSATADISALPNCVYVLKISDVQLTGTDGKSHAGGKELETQPIRFSMNNGKVESELCSGGTGGGGRSETHAALNIKRAVLSLLQSSANIQSGHTYLRETDIFGTCPTSFDVSKQGDKMTVKKHRPLNECVHREEVVLPFSTTPYALNSDMQSNPEIEASMVSEQEVVSGVVKSAESVETYKYGGLEFESGPTVTVRTHLSLVSQAKGAPIPAAGNERKSIMFELPHQKDGEVKMDVLIEHLKKACESSLPHVQLKSASDFRDLVRVLANAKKSDILAFYNKAKSGSVCSDREVAKKLALDAISNAKSSVSVEAMAELILKKEVTGMKSELWLLALGSARHLNKGSLKAVLPLLDGEPSTAAYLGIGMLVGRFCQTHRCQGIKELEQLEAKMAAPLADCHPTSHHQEDHLIASIKALGNTHYLTTEVAAKLSACAADKSVKARIRVAALEAMRTDPKKDECKNTASLLLKDLGEDSEIRIKAYLVVAENPTSKSAELIKDVLDNEKVFQVGNFIVSHLRNIRSSTNPDKDNAKHHFGNIKTNKQFPFDFRKYSTNSELSYSLDGINMGASAESNLIYSQKSYIPRSLSLNLTTQIFGHAFNFLELDLRTENLEHRIEKWFAPKGYLNTKDPNEIEEEGRAEAKKLYDTFLSKYKKTMRVRRSGTEENKDDDECADIDISMKVHGAEVAWFNYHLTDSPINKEKIMDSFFDQMTDSVDKAKDFDIDYNKHSAFIDMEVAYPTGLGLPLRLKVSANTALKLKMNGKFDVPSMIKDPKNIDIKFQLLPSAVIDVIGDLTVDGEVIETGLRMCASVHTATGSDLSLSVLQGKQVDVKLGVPMDSQEVVSLTTDVLSITTNRHAKEHLAPVQFNTKRMEQTGCFDQLESVTGLIFCGTISTPWEGAKTFSPIFGKSKFSLKVAKKDPSLTHYHARASYNTGDDNSFEVYFETPNTKEKRRISAGLSYGLNKNKYLKLDLESPWYYAHFNSKLVNTDQEKLLSANLNMSGLMEYGLQIGAKVSGTPDNRKFTPFFKYSLPTSEQPKLVGKKGGDKPKDTYQVKGTFTATKQGEKEVFKFNDLSFAMPKATYKLNGQVTTETQFIEGNVDVISSEADKISPFFTLKGGFDGRSDQTKSAKLEFVPHTSADLGINLSWNFHNETDENNKSTMKSTLVIVHGPDPKSTETRVTIENHLEMCDKPMSIKTENHVSYPVFNIDGRADFMMKAEELRTHLKIQAHEYEGGSTFHVKIGGAHREDGSLKFEVNLMADSIYFDVHHTVTGAHESNFGSTLKFNKEKEYSVKGNVVRKFLENDMDFHVASDMRFPFKPNVLSFAVGVKHNADECHGLFNMKAESNVLINFDLKMKTDGGYLNLNLPGHLNIDGKYTLENNHMKGNAKATFPKVDREMNAIMDIEAADPNYNGIIDFCWDTKDPKKSLKIETNSVFEKGSIQTKNVLHFNEYVTKFNAKGKTTGTYSDGTISGEAEIVLPNSLQLGGKFSRSLHMKGDAFDGEFIGEFTEQHEDGEQQKFNVKLVGKNVNVEKGLFDGTGSMSYVSPSKKDFNLNGKIKNVHPDKSKWKLDGEFDASGSYLDHPMNLKFETELGEGLFDGKLFEMGKLPPYSYHVSSSYGPSYTFNSNGKGKGNMFSCEMSFNLPEGHPVQNVKWSSSNFVDIVGKDTPRKVKTNSKLSWNNDKFINFNGEVCEEDNGANFNFDWESNDESKRTLSGAVHSKGGRGEAYVGDMSVALNWDSQTADFTLKAEVDKSQKASHWHLLGQTPQTGKFDISTKAQTKDGNGFYGELSATIKDKTTTGTAKVEFNEGPHIDLTLDHDGKKSVFFHKMAKKGPKHYASETKFDSAFMKSLNYEANIEINYENFDNFLYKVDVNCPALKMDKVQVDVSSRPSGGKTPGKKIMISVTKSNEVIVSGSTSYTVKESGDTQTVEGTGNVKYRGEEFPLKFKLASEPYNGKGRKVTFESTGGKYKFNMKMERNSSHFLIERTICKETSKCSTAVMQYSSSGKGTSYENTIKMQLDFSFFNPELNDFYFNWNNNIDGLLHDNNFEMKWSKSGRIQYHNYVKSDGAGFKLVLPQRTVVGEIIHDSPKGKIEASLWLDRVKSPKRTHLVLQCKSQMDKQPMTLSGSAAFNHPALKKKLQISGKLSLKNDWKDTKSGSVEGSGEIDIFNEPSEKINVVLKASMKKTEDYSANGLLSVKSDGCGINMKFENDVLLSTSLVKFNEKYSYIDSKNQERKAVFSRKFSPTDIQILMKLPDFTLMDITYKMEKGDNKMKIVGNVDVAGSKYQEVYELSTKPSFHYEFKLDKAGGEKLFVVDAGVVNEEGNAKMSFDELQIVEFDIDLSEKNFLKTKFNHHTENFKKFYDVLVKSMTHMTKNIEKGLQSTVSNAVDDGKFFLEKVKNALPNFQDVLDAYGGQLKAMMDELAQDETIKSGLAFLKKNVNKSLEAFVTVLEEISGFFNSMTSKLKEGAENLYEAMRNSYEEIRKSVARIGQLCVHIMEELLQFSLKILDVVTKELKKYEEDINIVLDGVSSFTHAAGGAVAGFAREVFFSLKGFTDSVLVQFKDFDILELMGVRYGEMGALPPEVTEVLMNIVEVLSSILPTEELKDLVADSAQYIKKVINREPFDETAAMKDMYEKLVASIKSVVSLVTSTVPELESHELGSFALPTIRLWKIPTGSVRLSLISWLFSRDLPSLKDVFTTYFVPLLNPLNLIPPFKTGAVIIGGSEIITFDGVHYSLKGSCTYMLAKDVHNGHFTILANVANGKLNSITMAEPNNSIEIRRNQNMLVNGKASEYPRRAGELTAWRRPNRVGVHSSAGATVICRDDFTSCYIKTSGFYFGALRGLLGNPNYEPYDDFSSPTGQISGTSAAFVNSWKEGATCADVPETGPHDHKREPECTKFFTDDNNLSLCYMLVNPKPFRDACDHLVATAPAPEARKAAACGSVASYARLCQSRGFPLAETPDSCVTCTMDKEKVPFGKSITVTTPGSSADVVFVVEQLKSNEQLFKTMVPSLVAALSNEFKQKGINDVYYGLVGFGNPKNRWPEYFTTDGKIVYNGKADNLNFYDEFKEKNTTLVDKYRLAMHYLNREIGNTGRSDVYWDVGTAFKFRPHSVKTVIAIHSNPCEMGQFVISPGLVKVAFGFGLYKYTGINVNYVIPGTVTAKGEASQCIVGFDDDHYYTLDSGSERPLKKTKYEDLDLQDDSDVCTTFTTMLNGNVFSGGNFMNEKPPQKKQFLSVMSQRIVESMTEKETFECTCSKYDGIYPLSRCHVDSLNS